MRLLKLFKTEIVDQYLRENFARIEKYAAESIFDKGSFAFFSFALGSDVLVGYPATFDVLHRLSFRPTDVIQLSVTPDSAVVAWNYDSFTRSTVNLTVDKACTVRAFIGRYGES
jgi:hypothetical protein